MHGSEQRLEREPHRKIQDRADDRSRDRRQRLGQRPFSAPAFDVGRAQEDPQKARREGDPRRHDRPQHSGHQRFERSGIAERAKEGDPEVTSGVLFFVVGPDGYMVATSEINVDDNGVARLGTDIHYTRDDDGSGGDIAKVTNFPTWLFNGIARLVVEADKLD